MVQEDKLRHAYVRDRLGAILKTEVIEDGIGYSLPAYNTFITPDLADDVIARPDTQREFRAMLKALEQDRS